MDKYLTSKEVAELLKINRSTLQRYKSKGIVNPIKIRNTGKLLFPKSQIKELLNGGNTNDTEV